MPEQRHDAKKSPPRDKYGLPSVNYPTPTIEDVIIVEDVPIRVQNYEPLEYGTPHPKIPTAYLVSQSPVQGDDTDKRVRRIYANKRSLQDTYNYAVSWAGESITHPIVVRSYILPREDYDPYEKDDPELEKDPEFVGAVLTSEQMQPADGELGSLFVRVTRVYEVLPGPILPFTRYDDNLGPVQGYRQAVRYTGTEVASLTGTTKVTYEAREGSVIVAWKLSETWSDGTGGPGNPLYPITVSDTYDELRGAVQTTSQIVVATGSEVGSITQAGGTVTEIEYEPYNQFLLRKVVRTYAVPGPALPGKTFDQYGNAVTTTRNVVVSGTAPSAGFLILEDQVTPQNKDVSVRETSTVASYGNLIGHSLRLGGTLLRSDRSFVTAGTLPTGGTGVQSDAVKPVTIFKSQRDVITHVEADGVTPIDNDNGYVLISTDNQTNALVYTTYRARDYGDTLPAIGSEFGTDHYVIDVSERAIDADSSDRVMQIIQAMDIPDPFVEFPEVSQVFPGVFRFTTFQTGTYEGRFQPPWAGDGIAPNTFYYIKPRSRNVVARVINLFYNGPSGDSAVGFSVYTPGTGSRLFQIAENTIHGPIVVAESVTTGLNTSTYTVENIGPSSPASYDIHDILTFPGGERRYRGNIYWRKIVQMSEGTSPSDFGPLYASRHVTAISSNPINGQPKSGGSRLMAVSSSGSDTSVQLIVYGKRDSEDGIVFSKEKITLNGTTPVFTSGSYLWHKVKQARVTSSPTGTITLKTAGIGATGIITVTNNAFPPLDGDTVEVGKTASTRTYTFKMPPRDLVTVVKSGLATSGTADGIKVTLIDTDTVAIWFNNTDGATTDPAISATETIQIDFSASTSTDSSIELSIIAALNSNSLFSSYAVATHTTGAVLAITGLGFGTQSLTDYGTSWSTNEIESGSGLAANQVRTGYTLAGEPATGLEVFEHLAATVNGTGTVNREYSQTTTVPHADISAAVDDVDSIFLSSRDEFATAETFVLNETSSGLTKTAFASGADGALIATLTNALQEAHKDVIFENSALHGNNPHVMPAGEIEENFPGYVGTLTSSWIPIPDKQCKLIIGATGTPALPVAYDTSTDGSTPIAGVTSLPSIGGGGLHEVNLAESSIKYIRVKVSNTTGPRAVHVAVLYSVL